MGQWGMMTTFTSEILAVNAVLRSNPSVEYTPEDSFTVTAYEYAPKIRDADVLALSNARAESYSSDAVIVPVQASDPFTEIFNSRPDFSNFSVVVVEVDRSKAVASLGQVRREA